MVIKPNLVSHSLSIINQSLSPADPAEKKKFAKSYVNQMVSSHWRSSQSPLAIGSFKKVFVSQWDK